MKHTSHLVDFERMIEQAQKQSEGRKTQKTEQKQENIVGNFAVEGVLCARRRLTTLDATVYVNISYVIPCNGSVSSEVSVSVFVGHSSTFLSPNQFNPKSRPLAGVKRN